MTIERRNVGKRLSDLVIYAPPPGGRLVYLAGQVAEDPTADITAQTRSVLAQIDRLLGEAASARLVDVRAHGQLKPDVFIGLGVLVRNRARADHSDSHG